MLHTKYQNFGAFCFLARICFNVFTKLPIDQGKTCHILSRSVEVEPLPTCQKGV